MEAGGVEPPSRDVSEGVSTCVVGHLRFASGGSDRQDTPSASEEIFSPDSFPAAEFGQPTDVVHIH